MEYQIDHNVLTVNGNRVQFDDRIYITLEIAGELIVLLRNEPGQDVPLNNIYAVDHNGNLLWQIQDTREEIYLEPGWEAEMYLEIQIKEDKLRAFSNSGVIFEVDPHNGKVKRIGWTK